MKHIYCISLIGGLWRLMRDDKLHSTYTSQGAAKAGMATEQARDEKKVIEDTPAYSMDQLIARLWQDAAYSSHYSLELWEQFKDRFDDLYARAYAARKGD